MNEACDETITQQPNGNGFEPLVTALEAWFGKPFSELPAELRQLVNKHFLISWDRLSPRQQHDVASQSDYSRDPAFDFEGGFWFDLTDRRDCWKRKRVKELKAPHKDSEIHDIRLARIDLELTELAAEEAEITAVAPPVERAAMTRIRGQWEERDKNATRQLAGLQSIESPAQPAAASAAETQSTTASEANRALYHTGVPGRPSSKSLWLAEYRRRAEAGLLEPKVAAEARHLADWLVKIHPKAPLATALTIENKIRNGHYSRVQSQTPQ